jgi:PAS domain S-box-containing protein
VVVDPGGHIELANARVEQLFGYRRSDLLGQRIATLAPATTAGEAPEDLVRRLLPAEVPPDAVARVTTTGRRQDGSEFPVEISAAGLAPDLHAVAVFFRDITALRDTESRYQRLFEASPEAIVVVDPSGLIQHVNAAAERLFGHPREELVGQTVDALLPDHPVAIYRREADQVPTGPGAPPTPVGLELVGRSRDGTEFPVEMSVGHVRTDAGQVMLLIRDMTEVAGSRAVLEHSIEVLRAAGQEHRNVLVDLVRAQERERLRIAAGIHDDSLQVITAASLRLQQLRRRLRDPEDLKIMAKVEETIKLAADRLRRMIFDFRPPALEEEGVVTALQIYLDQLHEDTGLSYRLDSQLEQEPPLEARVVIYRIAQEALMNVRKHARANRVRVQLSPADGGCLVEIVDDGVGYYPQRTEARSGHLGLILMRDRAEIAGGWCRVESAPGEGTTVEFWIPLDLGAAPGNDGETGPGGR